ncbi:UNVERIFIED_CONTAM: hypothetical protein GTU68_065995 [Idotea baltica]|nr:hypothetical protein [Idotea baltica]
MEYISKALILIVALEHIYFLVLEMFMWTRPRTIKIFGLGKDLAEKTQSMAANQGLYNGFLAAGLLWGLIHPNPEFGFQIQLFFLVCVLVAGIYGGYSVKKTILFVQGIPALLAILSLILIN